MASERGLRGGGRNGHLAAPQRDRARYYRDTPGVAATVLLRGNVHSRYFSVL